MPLDPSSLRQRVLWTALPNGVDSGAAKLTAFISPHLYANENTTLINFADFLTWPALLNKARFSVIFDKEPPVDAKPATLENNASDYWKALFTEKTPVFPFDSVAPDQSKRTMWSYPVRSVLDYVLNLYQETAVFSPFQLPAVVLNQHTSPISRMVGDLHGIKIGDFTSATQPLRDAYLFYNRPAGKLKVTLPSFDFHQALSALGDHPAALRKLGLIIDFVVPMPVRPNGTVRLKIDWGAGAAPAKFHRDLCPRTAYLTGGDLSFQAGPALNSEFADGLLTLTGAGGWLDTHHPLYDLVQIDPDGAILKLLNTAETFNAGLWTASSLFDKEFRGGLPNLRTAGISLTRAQRKDWQDSRLKAAATLKAQASSDERDDYTLHAEDLLRGYRLDIFDQDGSKKEWRSLCRRTGQLAFTASNLAPLKPDDEGYVKSATASSPEQGGDLYLHESLFHWDGWSLAAPRPGLSTHSATEYPDHPTNTPTRDFPFQAVYQVKPGTLPRLRFGRTYRLRVRAADLAGNSRMCLPDDEKGASNPITYQRYEPLSPPLLTPVVTWKPKVPGDLSYSPGESLEHLVIRSNQGTSAADYATQNAANEFRPDNQRHLTPPRTSQAMAETHSAFDHWLDKGEFDEAFKIASKENGQLGLYEPGTSVEIPYLPDVTAEGVSLWFNPEEFGGFAQEWEWEEIPKLESQMGSQAQVFPDLPVFAVHIPWSNQTQPKPWPDARSFRIRVREAGQAGQKAYFDWDPTQRILTVLLQKAAVVRLRYSSCPLPAMLDQYGTWVLIRQACEKFHSRPFAHLIDEKTAAAGLNWLLTPFRELTMVHAVQQPVIPQLLQLTIDKQLGWTYAALGADCHQNTASTGKIELLAAWTEPRDDPKNHAAAQPVIQNHKQQVIEFQVSPRYSDLLTIGAGTGTAAVAGLERVRHEFGDTHHRIVKYHLRAATRFREYFPDDILQNVDNITQNSNTLTVNVMSSSRPPAPKVVYVLPNFGWSSTALPNGGVKRIRQGGLRIYLERPWYLSGEGELLGVLLLQSNNPASIPDSMKKLVTQWGADPLWHAPSGKFSPLLAPADFLVPQHGDRAAQLPYNTSGRSYSLSEIPGQAVLVAGFPVQYNPERALWYCDLQINEAKVTAHMPFLRLALARFQPNSVDDAHLSPVALTDFIQLPPHRTLTVNRQFNGALDILLEGVGPETSGLRWLSCKAWVQAVDPQLPTELHHLDPLGWVDQGAESGGVLLTAQNLATEPGQYKWQMHLDQTNMPQGTGRRLVIVESETYKQTNNLTTDRVVFVDTIAI